MSEIKRWDTVDIVDLFQRFKKVPERLVDEADYDAVVQERDTLARRVRELHGCLFELRALVRGECPSLLNEDSGGDAWLDLRIEKVLAAPPVRD